MGAPPDLVAFCESEYPLLVGMLGLYCGDACVAEDMAQEALVRACRDWRTVRNHDNPRAWVRRVAINLSHSYFRRKRAEKRATGRLVREYRRSHGADPQDAVALRSAVAALPRRERTAIILHYYLGMTFVETAEVMDVPLSTAKSLSTRGLQRMTRSSTIKTPMEERHEDATQ